MITSVKARGFKSHPFEQPLTRLNLITGANGSGKTARSEALQLLLNGYICGQGKRNQDIFDACAPPGTDKIFVECQIGKVGFLKRYAKNDDGSVSLEHQVSAYPGQSFKTVKPVAYAAEMGKAGAPKIVDLSVFMGFSDRKKIDELFTLFPSEGDLASLDQQIIDTKEALNSKTQMMKTKENLIAALAQSQARVELVGTMAEITAEGKQVTAKLEAAKSELITEQARIAAEDAQAQAERQREDAIRRVNERNSEEQKQKDNAHALEMQRLNQQAEEEKRISEQKYRDLANKSKEVQEREKAIIAAEARLKQNAAKVGELPNALKSIALILRVMASAGCGECTAAMIARREQRKFQAG